MLCAALLSLLKLSHGNKQKLKLGKCNENIWTQFRIVYPEGGHTQGMFRRFLVLRDIVLIFFASSRENVEVFKKYNYETSLVARRAYCVGEPQVRMCVRPIVRACVRPSVRACVPLFLDHFLERQNADTTRETLQKGSRKWSIFAHTLIWGSNWDITTCDGSEDRDITSF